jgi:ribose/xylose/arabinose/galactoside ABC-type transport system permease subunit
MIVTGIVIGSINGFAVAYLNMIPFVVTLSMQAIVTGASIWITNMTSVTGVQEVFINAVLHKVWIIPVPVIFLVIVVALAHVLMRNSIYARWLYALGTNVRTSRASGIPTKRLLAWLRSSSPRDSDLRL